MISNSTSSFSQRPLTIVPTIPAPPNSLCKTILSIPAALICFEAMVNENQNLILEQENLKKALESQGKEYEALKGRKEAKREALLKKLLELFESLVKTNKDWNEEFGISVVPTDFFRVGKNLKSRLIQELKLIPEKPYVHPISEEQIRSFNERIAQLNTNILEFTVSINNISLVASHPNGGLITAHFASKNIKNFCCRTLETRLAALEREFVESSVYYNIDEFKARIKAINKQITFIRIFRTRTPPAKGKDLKRASYYIENATKLIDNLESEKVMLKARIQKLTQFNAAEVRVPKIVAEEVQNLKREILGFGFSL